MNGKEIVCVYKFWKLDLRKSALAGTGGGWWHEAGQQGRDGVVQDRLDLIGTRKAPAGGHLDLVHNPRA